MTPSPRIATLIGDLGDARPAYHALAERLRLLIIDGRLVPGTRLPSERELTASLGVSRTTVTRAYDVLREKGFAVSRHGSGTLARLPDGRRQPGTGVLMRAETEAGVIDLTCAATRAPAGAAQAYQWAVEQVPPYLAGAGYFSAGLPDLRAAIADRYAARGLPTDPDQILVTSGAVAGIAVAAQALLRPGMRVVVESPTYPNSLELLRQSGIRLLPTPVDASGWDVATTSRDIAAAAPAAALLLPDHHNPTGAYMSDDDRERVAAALRRAGALPIIDETVAEVALDHPGEALPFAAHHREAILVGSASKTFWGGLRTGWIRAPRAVIPQLLQARATTDLCAPVLEQLATLHLLRTHGGLPAETRDALRESRDRTAAALRERLPEWSFVIPPGGLSLWIDLGTPVAARLVHAAQGHGLLLAAGSRFAARGRLDRWLRLPYVLAQEEMDQAVSRLLDAAADAARGDRPPAQAAEARERPLVA